MAAIIFIGNAKISLPIKHIERTSPMNDISVLVVDDEQSVLRAISYVLKHENINCCCASNCKQAFD